LTRKQQNLTPSIKKWHHKNFHGFEAVMEGIYEKYNNRLGAITVPHMHGRYSHLKYFFNGLTDFPNIPQ